MDAAQTRPPPHDLLSERLDLMSLDDASMEALHNMAPSLAEALPEGVNRFFAHIQALAGSRQIFESDEEMAFIRQHHIKHWRSLVKADFDAEFVDSALQMGKINARLGLEPRRFLGGSALILEKLITAHLHMRIEGSILQFRRLCAKKLGLEITALVKAALLDIGISFDAYLEKIDDAYKRATIEQAFAQDTLSEALDQVADGNLTPEIASELSVKSGFGAAIDRIRDILVLVRRGTDKIQTHARKISDAANDMDDRSRQQADSLKRTAALIEEIEGVSLDAAAYLRKSHTALYAARNDALATELFVSHLHHLNAQNTSSWTDMLQFVQALDDIALQANRITQNAGEGLAPDARMLAQRVSGAAQTIRSIVDAGAGQVQEAARLVADMPDAIGRLSNGVHEAIDLTDACIHAGHGQYTQICELQAAVRQFVEMTEQNAQPRQKISAATVELTSEARTITRAIRRYRIDP